MRLLGISLAGGLVSAAACIDEGKVIVNYAPDAAGELDGDTFRCNANPDPCCADPDGSACLAKDAASDAPEDALHDAPNDALSDATDAGSDAPGD